MPTECICMSMILLLKCCHLDHPLPRVTQAADHLISRLPVTCAPAPGGDWGIISLETLYVIDACRARVTRRTIHFQLPATREGDREVPAGFLAGSPRGRRLWRRL